MTKKKKEALCGDLQAIEAPERQQSKIIRNMKIKTVRILCTLVFPVPVMSMD